VKIAILIDQLILGGVQKIALKQAQALKKLGHQVEVLVLIREGSYPQLTELSRGLSVKHLSDHYPFLFRKSIKLPLFSFLSTGHLLSPLLTPRIISNCQYDLLISHGSTTCLSAQKIYQKRHIPFLAFVYDPMIYILQKIYSQTWPEPMRRILTPVIKTKEISYLKSSLAVSTQSITSQQHLKQAYGINSQVTTPGCQPLSKIPPKRGSYLLALSRWSLKKDPAFLLKILKQIPKTRLKIAGVWESKKHLNIFQKQIKQANLKSRLELITSFTEQEKRNLFQKARAWIHPHLEGFGMGALSAAECGCPIIMPKGSGAAYLFQHKKHGYFPKEGDLSAFVSYTKQLITNERLAWRLGKNAWEEVKNKYTWNHHARTILRIAKENLSPQKIPLIALETGHVSSKAESGGDLIFKQLQRFLPKKYAVKTIIPPLALPHWQKISHNVTLITLPKDPFHESQNRLIILFNYLWRTYHSLQALKRQACYKSVVVYSSTNIFPDIIPAYIFKKLHPQIKWIARIHHLTPSPHRRPGKLITKSFIFPIQKIALKCIKEKADVVLVLNSSLKEKLISIGFPKSKIKISGAGIYFKKIQACQNPKKEKEFLGIFLGRFHPAKGIFDLPSIWASVCQHKPQAKLAIVGEADGKTVKQLVGKFKQTGVPSSNYQIYGFLPEAEKFKILAKSRLFLFCDHEAGWGIAPAEAMACKIPVVGYNLPIFGSVFKQGFITVPCFNTKDFSNTILNLLNNQKQYQRLSQEAYDQAKNLDWEKTGLEFNKLINSLISSQS